MSESFYRYPYYCDTLTRNEQAVHQRFKLQTEVEKFICSLYFLIHKITSLGICCLSKGGWYTFDNSSIRIGIDYAHNSITFRRNKQIVLCKFINKFSSSLTLLYVTFFSFCGIDL